VVLGDVCDIKCYSSSSSSQQKEQEDYFLVEINKIKMIIIIIKTIYECVG
jgi:hypothetical protein